MMQRAYRQQRWARARRACRLAASLAVGSALVLATHAAAFAQQGSVTGRVVDAELGEPIAAALVEVVTGTGSVVGSATTENDGNFTIAAVPPGTYSLIVSTFGYRTQRVDGVSVGAGATRVEPVKLVSRAFELNPIVVTASRGREKALDAPASVYTVEAEEIRDAQVTTVVDYIRTQPGIDAVTYGIQQHNVVARGFNNVFSGALYVLTDNRWASVPSLRLNAYNLIPVTNDDIERIETVLGPGSALYGPNVDRGVMHMITSSPLDKQEMMISISGGARGPNDSGDARSIFQGAFRYAGKLSDRVGLKVSGSYLRGKDWVSTDPAEEVARAAAVVVDPATRIGARSFDAERATADVRLDVQTTETGRFVLAGGTAALLSSIELTGIGAAQADNWLYSYVQARYSQDRLFAQAYVNFSDSGDSFTLRDGRLVSDNSALWVGQIQHGLSLADGRETLTYGVDVIRTIPATDGTIHGDNEEDDNIWEVGSYLQSETSLSDQWQLVLAGRVDYHDVIDDVVFSPRAALVFKPVPEHSVRATFNRAFSPPTSVNLFLDLPVSPRGDPAQGGSPFGVHAGGVPADGYSFARDAQGNPMMRTFWAGLMPGVDENDFLPLDATLLWPVAVQLLLLGGGPDLSLLPAPTADQVGTQLRALNTTTLAFDDVPVTSVQDIPALDPTITNTIEGGYKGIIADRLLLGVDVYYTQIQDFVGPLRVETPSVFLDREDLEAYLTPFVGPAAAQQIAVGMAGIPGDPNNTGIPLATVTPQNTAAQNTPADVLLTYRQFGDVDLWGVDVGAELLLGYWSVSGSYSYVSEDLFRNLDGVGDISLNSPQNKASLGIEYRNPRLGLSTALRGRWVDSFPVNSGVFIGQVEDYAVADLNIAYTLPWHRNAAITLTGLNIFNNKHREIVGAPEISTLWLLRVRYNVQ